MPSLAPVPGDSTSALRESTHALQSNGIWRVDAQDLLAALRQRPDSPVSMLVSSLKLVGAVPE